MCRNNEKCSARQVSGAAETAQREIQHNEFEGMRHGGGYAEGRPTAVPSRLVQPPFARTWEWPRRWAAVRSARSFASSSAQTLLLSLGYFAGSCSMACQHFVRLLSDKWAIRPRREPKVVPHTMHVADAGAKRRCSHRTPCLMRLCWASCRSEANATEQSEQAKGLQTGSTRRCRTLSHTESSK